MHFSDFTKWKKRLVAFSSDLLMTAIALFAANWLSNNFLVDYSYHGLFLIGFTLFQSSIYIYCGLYRGVWRFASIPDLLRILKAVLIGSSVGLVVFVLTASFPIQTLIVYSLLLFILLSGSRLLYRLFQDSRLQLSHPKRVLIVGAGNAGEGIIRDLSRSLSVYQYQPILIVDDDETRVGGEVRSVPILGTCRDIPKLAKTHKIDLILIAIPSATSKRMREIVHLCEESGVPFRTLPSLKDIADGIVTTNALRQVLIEDLLGREEVDLDWQTIKDAVKDKTILVTGGGGSIGSELCRQLAALSPKKIIIIDNNEFNLYSIEMELNQTSSKGIIYPHLCDITDQVDIEHIFNNHHPDLVFHVAAYKHVPLLEKHLRNAMFNNIIGTKIVAELAEKYHVETFVLISTDKAVNPTSVMGATKRISEIFCQTYNNYSKTKFLTVRFGNVLESAGSVIPLFRSQILKGGPLTVTHQNITRYFMTIPEAAQLILQAATLGNSGNIFVLDMGEPIKIRYLAEQMIKLSGKVVDQDIEIVYTGLRPGEKLYEELFHENENICETSYKKIKQAKVREYHWTTLLDKIAKIEAACKRYDEVALGELLCELVPEYQPISMTEVKNNANASKDFTLNDVNLELQ